jgi:hypothetical protein
MSATRRSPDFFMLSLYQRVVTTDHCETQVLLRFLTQYAAGGEQAGNIFPFSLMTKARLAIYRAVRLPTV